MNIFNTTYDNDILMSAYHAAKNATIEYNEYTQENLSKLFEKFKLEIKPQNGLVKLSLEELMQKNMNYYFVLGEDKKYYKPKNVNAYPSKNLSIDYTAATQFLVNFYEKENPDKVSNDVGIILDFCNDHNAAILKRYSVRKEFFNAQTENLVSRNSIDTIVHIGIGMCGSSIGDAIKYPNLQVVDCDMSELAEFRRRAVTEYKRETGIELKNLQYGLSLDVAYKGGIKNLIASAGIKEDAKVLYKLEGVIPHMKREEVELMIENFAEISAKGSHLIFSYLLDENKQEIKDTAKSAISRNDMIDLLYDNGFAIREHQDSNSYIKECFYNSQTRLLNQPIDEKYIDKNKFYNTDIIVAEYMGKSKNVAVNRVKVDVPPAPNITSLQLKPAIVPSEQPKKN